MSVAASGGTGRRRAAHRAGWYQRRPACTAGWPRRARACDRPATVTFPCLFPCFKHSKLEESQCIARAVQSLSMRSAWSGFMLRAAGTAHELVLGACRSTHDLPCYNFAIRPLQAASPKCAPDAGYRIVQQRERFHQVRLACAPVQDPAWPSSCRRDSICTPRTSSLVNLCILTGAVWEGRLSV